MSGTRPANHDGAEHAGDSTGQPLNRLFERHRARVASSFIQPILFLFVLGYGMSTLVGTTGGFDFKKFVFPGIVAMSVVLTAMFSAISIVWDREFGFLREMLVAPVSRGALVIGKTLGGASIATVQGTIMLVLAPLIGVHLTALLVVEVIGLELLMAVAMTTFGVFVASRIQRMEGFQVVMQLLLFPMLFLSGALFPLNGLPSWLSVLTRINPLTYAVDPLRHVVFAAQHMPPAAAAVLQTGQPLRLTLPIGADSGSSASSLPCPQPGGQGLRQARLTEAARGPQRGPDDAVMLRRLASAYEDATARDNPRRQPDLADPCAARREARRRIEEASSPGPHDQRVVPDGIVQRGDVRRVVRSVQEGDAADAVVVEQPPALRLRQDRFPVQSRSLPLSRLLAAAGNHTGSLHAGPTAMKVGPKTLSGWADMPVLTAEA